MDSSSRSSSSVPSTSGGSPSKPYKCHLCEYTTYRINVIILHIKSHKFDKSPITQSSTAPGPKTSSISSTSSPSTGSSPATEEQPKVVALATNCSPPPRTKRGYNRLVRQYKALKLNLEKANEIDDEAPMEPDSAQPDLVESIAPVEEVEEIQEEEKKEDKKEKEQPPKSQEEIKSAILADWSDDDTEENSSLPKSIPKARRSTNKESKKDDSPTERIDQGTDQSVKTADSTTITTDDGKPQSSGTCSLDKVISVPKYRNIPKKDRRDVVLKEFSNGDILTARNNATPKETENTVANCTSNHVSETSKERFKSTGTQIDASLPDASSGRKEDDAASTSNQNKKQSISCFDFQEEDDDEEFFTSLSKLKKKYMSPDKPKEAGNETSKSTPTNDDKDTEMSDERLTADIENLLNSTKPPELKSVPTQVKISSPTVSDTVSKDVRALPPKERGKRIFKSRNKSNLEETPNVAEHKSKEQSPDVQIIENSEAQSAASEPVVTIQTKSSSSCDTDFENENVVSSATRSMGSEDDISLAGYKDLPSVSSNNRIQISDTSDEAIESIMEVDSTTSSEKHDSDSLIGETDIDRYNQVSHVAKGFKTNFDSKLNLADIAQKENELDIAETLISIPKKLTELSKQTRSITQPGGSKFIPIVDLSQDDKDGETTPATEPENEKQGSEISTSGRRQQRESEEEADIIFSVSTNRIHNRQTTNVEIPIPIVTEAEVVQPNVSESQVMVDESPRPIEVEGDKERVTSATESVFSPKSDTSNTSPESKESLGRKRRNHVKVTPRKRILLYPTKLELSQSIENGKDEEWEVATGSGVKSLNQVEVENFAETSQETSKEGSITVINEDDTLVEAVSSSTEVTVKFNNEVSPKRAPDSQLGVIEAIPSVSGINDSPDKVEGDCDSNKSILVGSVEDISDSKERNEAEVSNSDEQMEVESINTDEGIDVDDIDDSKNENSVEVQDGEETSANRSPEVVETIEEVQLDEVTKGSEEDQQQQHEELSFPHTDNEIIISEEKIELEHNEEAIVETFVSNYETISQDMTHAVASDHIEVVSNEVEAISDGSKEVFVHVEDGKDKAFAKGPVGNNGFETRIPKKRKQALDENASVSSVSDIPPPEKIVRLDNVQLKPAKINTEENVFDINNLPILLANDPAASEQMEELTGRTVAARVAVTEVAHTPEKVVNKKQSVKVKILPPIHNVPTVTTSPTLVTSTPKESPKKQESVVTPVPEDGKKIGVDGKGNKFVIIKSGNSSKMIIQPDVPKNSHVHQPEQPRQLSPDSTEHIKGKVYMEKKAKSSYAKTTACPPSSSTVSLVNTSTSPGSHKLDTIAQDNTNVVYPSGSIIKTGSTPQLVLASKGTIIAQAIGPNVNSSTQSPPGTSVYGKNLKNYKQQASPTTTTTTTGGSSVIKPHSSQSINEDVASSKLLTKKGSNNCSVSDSNYSGNDNNSYNSDASNDNSNDDHTYKQNSNRSVKISNNEIPSTSSGVRRDIIKMSQRTLTEMTRRGCIEEKIDRKELAVSGMKQMQQQKKAIRRRKSKNDDDIVSLPVSPSSYPSSSTSLSSPPSSSSSPVASTSPVSIEVPPLAPIVERSPSHVKSPKRKLSPSQPKEKVAIESNPIKDPKGDLTPTKATKNQYEEINCPSDGKFGDGSLLAVPAETFGGPPNSFFLCTIAGNDGGFVPIDNQPLYLDGSNQLVPMLPEATEIICSEKELSPCTQQESQVVQIQVSPEKDPNLLQQGASPAFVIDTTDGHQILMDQRCLLALMANGNEASRIVLPGGDHVIIPPEILSSIGLSQASEIDGQILLSETAGNQDIIAAALAGTEVYQQEQLIGDVLQIETTNNVQIVDQSLAFQAINQPVTAQTNETNAILTQPPIMSTLEVPSNNKKAQGERINVSTSSETGLIGQNLDDSLAVIGVTSQTSTVPSSLELPITVTNPAIAPKTVANPIQLGGIYTTTGLTPASQISPTLSSIGHDDSDLPYDPFPVSTISTRGHSEVISDLPVSGKNSISNNVNGSSSRNEIGGNNNLRTTSKFLVSSVSSPLVAVTPSKTPAVVTILSTSTSPTSSLSSTIILPEVGSGVPSVRNMSNLNEVVDSTNQSNEVEIQSQPSDSTNYEDPAR